MSRQQGWKKAPAGSKQSKFGQNRSLHNINDANKYKRFHQTLFREFCEICFPAFLFTGSLYGKRLKLDLKMFLFLLWLTVLISNFQILINNFCFNLQKMTFDFLCRKKVFFSIFIKNALQNRPNTSVETYQFELKKLTQIQAAYSVQKSFCILRNSRVIFTLSALD